MIQPFSGIRLSMLAVCRGIILAWLSTRDKARECCDLVILSMYVFIPPGQGVEVCTLEIQRNWQQFHPNQVKDRKVLLVKDSQEVTLYFHKYKTAKFFGRQELNLKVSNIDHWDRLSLTVFWGNVKVVGNLVLGT